MNVSASTLKGNDYLLNKKVIETQFPLLINFARSLGSYRAISADFARIYRNKSFWIQTADSNFLRAVSIWCMIFGVNDNETHWKKAPESDQIKMKAEICALIRTASKLTPTQWEKYHEEIRNFRNTFVSHRSLVIQGNVPDMTAAKEIACAYFEWLKKQIPGSGQPQPLGGYFAECQIEVLAVLQNDLNAAAT